MCGACKMHVGIEKYIEIFLSETRRGKALGRPRHKWVDNIKINLIEIKFGDVRWIQLLSVTSSGGP
jgi:hypothetical protein